MTNSHLTAMNYTGLHCALWTADAEEQSGLQLVSAIGT